MRKSNIRILPDYFDYYINLSDDIELDEAFAKSLKQIDDMDVEKLKRIGLQVYEEGKWSVHKIIQHVSDWERIWCYRTLISVRNEGKMPTGLDHNTMADNSNADRIPIEKLIHDLRVVRKATIAMFDTFDQGILESECHFNNISMCTLGMGFNIVGHQIHHFNVIKEKYIPLIES